MNVENILILAEAELDLDDGRNFYESQARGIGEYFWDCLLADIESLLMYAGIHGKKYGYYRMSSKRFPYSIYYEVDGNTAYVVAVLPMRRNPDWVIGKMPKRN
jgi:predicted glutamine amidotransferase